MAAPAAAGAHPASGSRVGWIWLAYAVFVVYGSLVPLDFQGLPLQQAWQSFLATPYLDLDVQSRADWVANGVLYAPLGALGALTLGRGRAGWASATLAIVLACLLAVGVEFTQLHFPPRTVSQNDLIAEGIGSVLGAGAAFVLAPWLARWRKSLLAELPRVLQFMLPAYALAYLLYCGFPFDLLLSRQELLDKLATGNWGWFVARPEGYSVLRTLLQALAEVVLTLPLGVWLVQRRVVAPALAAAAGALLGVTVELGQVVIASGLSQGLSVLTRAAGVACGAWLWPLWVEHGPQATRRWIDRHAWWLVWPWLAVLCLANGWGRHGWGGLARAEVSWAEIRFQPFYYHYFTTEAVALTSLGNVIVMYAPLALLAWARRSAPGAAGLLAACIATLVEASKLVLLETHPDPTNVLIAAVTVWLLVRLVSPPRLVSRRRHRHRADSAPPPASAPDGAAQAPTAPATAAPASPSAWLRRWPLQQPGLLLGLPVLVWVALAWPGVGLWLAAIVGAAIVVTWRWPVAALLLVPMALPMLDLAPWSGRFFVEDFDLLFLACFVVVMVRTGRSTQDRGLGLAGVVFVAFGLSLATSTIKGLAAAGLTWDPNLLAHYYSPLNGLRIAKGALLAWMFTLLARRLLDGTPARAAWFSAGLAAGLALTVLLVLWERLAFVGNPFDFAADYRVTGPFSAMHKGGAYIECFLAAASAFVVAEVVSTHRRWLFWGGTVLLTATAYAMFVTYSRNGYAAFAAVLVLGVVFGVRRAWGRARALVALAVMVGLVLAAALPVLGGSFAQDRLKQTRQDFAVRLAHWKAALDLRDGSAATTLFGAGVGRFPELHFWNSREPRAAGFRIEPGDRNAFLRLGPGAPVYIDQIVAAPVGQELNLTLNLRSAGGEPELTVTLCRKWLLTSSDCEAVQLKGIAAPGLWQTQDATIPPLPAPTSVWESLAPLKLSLTTPVKGRAIDVDNVSLRAGKSANLLDNGSFAGGMDHWFFATDVDPPWHIHSLPVAVLFDQGWFGVLAGLALAVTALVTGARAAWRGSTPGLAAFAGLVAFLISGTLNTLTDAPRFLALLLLLAWLCCWADRHARVPGPPGPGPGRPAP